MRETRKDQLSRFLALNYRGALQYPNPDQNPYGRQAQSAGRRRFSNYRPLIANRHFALHTVAAEGRGEKFFAPATSGATTISGLKPYLKMKDWLRAGKT